MKQFLSDQVIDVSFIPLGDSWRRLYDLGTRIQTKTANGVGDVGGEGTGEEIQTCQPGKEGAGCVGGEGSSGDTPGLSAHLGS